MVSSQVMTPSRVSRSMPAMRPPAIAAAAAFAIASGSVRRGGAGRVQGPPACAAGAAGGAAVDLGRHVGADGREHRMAGGPGVPVFAVEKVSLAAVHDRVPEGQRLPRITQPLLVQVVVVSRRK